MEERRTGLGQLLRKLESHFGFPHDYRIMWVQLDEHGKDAKGRPCKACIRGDVIEIFTSSMKEAQELLVHEFIEGILLSEFTEPYNDVINRLLGHFEDQSYRRRERLVNRLTRYIVKELVENGS